MIVYVGVTGGIYRERGKDEPLQDVYARAVSRADSAEGLGLDFVWIGEHHFSSNAYCPTVLPVLAHIAARTARIRLGTNVLVAPYYHPLRLAEDVAVVDLLSGGRLDLMVGAGSIEDESRTLGVPHSERFGRMFETLDILRRCFTEDRFDHHSKYFDFPDVRMTTRPVQSPFPLWVAGHGERTLTRAGREGYSVGIVDYRGVERGWGLHGVGAKESGVDRSRVGCQIFTYGHVARSMTSTEREEHTRRLAGFMGFYRGRVDDQWQASTPHPAARPLVGTPSEVLRELEPILVDSPVSHFGWRWSDRESMEVFANEVAPVLRSWGREQDL
jgi:alkanesulfonate monooxygenase SsuD/methylene tetrahydromethanopterin reductase-like flavin-dependent oxidoreductase (luciferase family)